MPSVLATAELRRSLPPTGVIDLAYLIYCRYMNSVLAREDPQWRAEGRRGRPFLLLTPCACSASFPAVPGLEVELVDIVLREPERIPQHDHVLQRERTLGRDVLGR